LQREDDVHRERFNSAFEMLRRLETEIEAFKATTNQISRLDDRLELVQAERTRHNERLNETAAALAKIDGRLNEFGERMALVEVRIGGYQDDLRALKGRLDADRELIGGYLHSLSELEADMRKRTIIALEKEIRDIRGRALNFGEE
jgi:chromosome segregation ATPase